VTHVLIVGLSTRAIAESAIRAGFAVTTIDAFADRDMPAAVKALSLPRDVGTVFTAQAAARAAADITCDAVVYASNFENQPEAVAALASSRAVWGNDSAVLRRVRNPHLLAKSLLRRGLPVPSIRAESRDDSSMVNDPSDVGGRFQPVEWLVKPLASGGGRGVRPWSGGPVPRGCYVQRRIDGVPGSVVFIAARGHAVTLGVSRQIVGDPAFGADGFRYCGNILAPAADPQFARDEVLLERVTALAQAAAEDFDLVGLNGLDFVASDGVPYPIEVNPRWCASMELVERAYGVTMFGAHAVACVAGTLPVFDLATARRGARAVGKAVVFAQRDVTMGDTWPWLEDPTVRDVPRSGEQIATGYPICTVLAEAGSGAACYEALVRRAARVYAELE